MNTQQIKSGKAHSRLHLVLSVCIAMTLIMGASAFSLIQSPTVQAVVLADLASPYQDGASGQMSMDSITAGTTGEVTVPVMLTGAVDVGTISAKVYFDSSKLKPLSCTNNETGGQCNIELRDGEVHFNVVYVDGLDGTSTMTEIVFEVLEESQEDLSFEFEVTESASSNGIKFPLEILEEVPQELTPDNSNDDRMMFLPLIQK